MSSVISMEKSGVKSILDKLKINKSAEFNKHCSVFKKTHNEIWNQLPFDAQAVVKGCWAFIRSDSQ